MPSGAPSTTPAGGVRCRAFGFVVRTARASKHRAVHPRWKPRIEPAFEARPVGITPVIFGQPGPARSVAAQRAPVRDVDEREPRAADAAHALDESTRGQTAAMPTAFPSGSLTRTSR